MKNKYLMGKAKTLNIRYAMGMESNGNIICYLGVARCSQSNLLQIKC